MNAHKSLELQPRRAEGGEVRPDGTGGWRLEIPAGEAGAYRLAQLDDYGALPRRRFPWRPPVRLSLRARASARTIPGTWGFGLWNNPFSLAVLRGPEPLRLPALPNAVWFFFAGPPNFLSLRDDLPAAGWLAATFRSSRLPAPLLALGAPALPLALLRPGARLLRRLARGLVRQDATLIPVDVREWHTYHLEWGEDQAVLSVDGARVLDSRVAPFGPLGLVLWVDNQYAALTPDGRIGFGALANPEPAWIEITGLELGPDSGNQPGV